MHRDAAALADGGIEHHEFEEARERIIERLVRLREQDAAIETKSLPDPARLIRWALARQ